jgi:outer membrane receptor protein involved in Fe transport
MTIVRAAVAHALRAATALTLGLASTAYAQTPTGNEQAAGGNQTLDEVTVTGSRIRRTTDFDTANPTTVVDDSYLRNLGIVNVGDAVAQMPANLSTNTPATTGNANFFTGSTIANLRGLNPFFGSRTLNLVNSQRFVPTNQGDGVDLNFIPSILIDRVDIVTGGASAAYGSGAIAGVNNIFLNRKLEGGKADVDFARTDENDGDERHVGLAYGHALFENRAHFVVGYEYEKTDPIGCYFVRDWCHEGNGFFQNQNPTSAPGPAAVPTWLLGSDIRSNQMSLTGTFYNNSRTASQTLQGNAAGNGTMAFNMGQQPYSGASATQVVPGGDGKSIYQYTNLRAPIKRNIATGTFTLALTDSVNMNVDLSYGKVETTDINGALDATNTLISAENAYIQGNSLAAAQTQFRQAAGPFAGNALVNKDWTSQVDSHSVFTTDVKRAVLGFDGKFGSSSWGWDAYYQYGLTNREQLVVDNRHLNAYNLAVDTIIDTATGQPRCRYRNAAEATGHVTFDPRIADGCVPLNPFGNQALTQAQHDYAFGNLDENLRYEQQVIALNASGDLFKGFAAGPIQGAIGAEYRVEKGDNIATVPGGTPDYVRTDYLIQYGESFAGDVDVTEGFVELNVPVFRDVPFAHKLEFNMSARESEYKNTGREGTTGEKRTHDMFTWKISGIWDPVDWLRVRATQSRDSRAANFRELYYRQIIGAGGTFGFCDSPPKPVRDPCTFDLRGNVNLKPESSDTTTIGLVFTPTEFLPGFNFAADYFRINIQDAILQASSTSVLNGCRNLHIQSFCDQLVTGPPSDPLDPFSNIEVLNAKATNGSGYLFKGIDLTGSYQHDVGENSTLNFRLLGTRMLKQLFQAQPGGAFINVVGQTGTGNSFLADNQPAAKWIANLSSTFNHGPYSMTGQVRYVGAGIMDYNGVLGRAATPGTTERSMSVNRVPSYQVFSLSGSYMFENLGVLSSLQIFGVVDNVFDRDPPVAPGSGPVTPSNANGGTNAVYFDTQGRTFRLGVRTTF